MDDLKYRDKKWLKEQFDLYKTPTAVSNNTGYPRTCITRYAKKLGIYQPSNRSGKLHVKEDYFNIIDTSDKAYFLGFIMADGCMYQRKDASKLYQFSLKIKSTDKDLLIKFSEFIEYDKEKIRNKVSERNGTQCKSVYIQINNQEFCKNLIKHGIVPQKSGKETFPQTIPDEFKLDFIRGFIDGDGWVYRKNKNDRERTAYEIGFCSASKEIIESINSYLLETCKIQLLVSEQKGLYSSKICSKYKVFKLLNRIYYDNCLSLNRKNNIAQLIRSEIYDELF